MKVDRNFTNQVTEFLLFDEIIINSRVKKKHFSDFAYETHVFSPGALKNENYEPKL